MLGCLRSLLVVACVLLVGPASQCFAIDLPLERLDQSGTAGTGSSTATVFGAMLTFDSDGDTDGDMNTLSVLIEVVVHAAAGTAEVLIGNVSSSDIDTAFGDTTYVPQHDSETMAELSTRR